MNHSDTPPTVTHDVSLQRFEATGGSYLSYTFEGDRVVFDHTYVPDEFRGQGLAAALTRSALEEARHRGWKIIPRCSYIATFIARNPEFADVVHVPQSEPP